MQPVNLILNGKEYSKLRPTVADWFNYLDISPRVEGQNVLTNKDAALAALELVSKYLEVSVEDIQKHGFIDDAMVAFNMAQKNIIEAFSSANSVWGKNVETPEK
jgi:hypothetical protein